MSKTAGVLVRIVLPAFLAAGVIAAPAMAQEKKAAKKMEPTAAGKPMSKEVLKNEKAVVNDVTYKPGDQSPSVERPPRVVIYVKGGTLQRIYPDGKKQNTTYKDGEVKYFEATPAYAVKNVGKTTIHLYAVQLPKQ